MHYGKAIGLAGLMIGLGVLMPQVGLPGRAQTVTQTVDQRKAEGDRLLAQGNKLVEQNQNKEAIGFFQKALVIYRELNDRQKEGQTLKDIGNVYRT